MMMSELKGLTVSLLRDLDALIVPDAYPVNLLAGTDVYISQALGNSYTIVADGKMMRVASEDADALGPEFVDALHAAQPELCGSPKEQVWQLLATCYDPEIPVSVVDLGLIYAVNLLDLDTEKQTIRAHIVMTLTAPGCGMGPILVEEIKQKMTMVASIEDAVVELVFDPPWSHDKMSDAAKLTLGVF